MWDRRNSLPPAESCNHDQTHNHGCDDRRVKAGLVGSVDDTDEGQDDSRYDERASQVLAKAYMSTYMSHAYLPT